MNKLDFLRRLDRELSALDQTERRELLAFYEERFYNGTIYENKTEEQVVAELESPEVIARNILSEYGISVREARGYNESRKPLPGNFNNRNNENRVSKRDIKDQERQRRMQEYQTDNHYQSNDNSFRTQGISAGKLVWLILVDVFILSWAIPSLFSIVASLSVSLVSYVGVFGFLSSDIIYDQMIFWFLTGAYVLLFLFTLAILEFFIWTCKKTLLWHMKVFKYKKIGKWNKRLSRVGVEAWFKRHKLLRFIKNISGIAAIFVITYTGFYLYGHYDDIKELYIDQEVLTDVQTSEMINVGTDESLWSITTDLDSMNVEIIPTLGDEIVVTRTYREDSKATYTVTIDEVNHTINVKHDLPNQMFNFSVSIEDIFSFLHKEEVVIEVPLDLILKDVDVETTNGTVTVYNLRLDDLTVDGSNGKIKVDLVTATGDVKLDSSNAVMEVKDSNGYGLLEVDTSNGRISVKNASFDDYILETSNGKIILESLNVALKDGVDLYARSSNGSLNFKEVYVAKVDIRTSNGDIDYVNSDLTFDIDLTRSTSNGQITSNVD